MPSPADLRPAVTFVTAATLVLLLTPIAISVARRFGLVDRPIGWKTHSGPTPYLGGAAVLTAVIVSTAVVGSATWDIAVLLACAGTLGAIGLVDDRRGVPAKVRVASEFAAGVVLWTDGWGWNLAIPDAANLTLTGLWVVGVVNATNLLDLMDGVASTALAASACALVVLGSIRADVAVTTLAAAVAGSCLAFLRFNLAQPARVFLGDAGTMSLGLVAAGLLTRTQRGTSDAALAVAAAVFLFGIPLLDMSFRIVLRLWRRVSLMTGGPDSLSNRVRELAKSPRIVCVLVGTTQLIAGSVAVMGLQLGGSGAAVLFTLVALAGIGGATALQIYTARGRPRSAGFLKPQAGGNDADVQLR